MARPHLLLLATLLLLPAAVFAEPLKPSYTLQDHGQRRTFVIAQDEVHREKRPQRVPMRASVEEMRGVAEASGGDLVLYEKGRPRSEATRRLVTERLAVRLAPGANPEATALAAGVANLGPAPGAPGWYLFQSGPPAGSALQAGERLRKLPGVLAADPQLAQQKSKRFLPNDTLFLTDQWYLRNTGQSSGEPGIDLNLAAAWDNFRGDGITIGIVDDGLERNHPDIAPNYRADVSYDFNGQDTNPLPPPFDGDDHGTACAGLAAAAGNNGIGLAGVAFNAKLAALRLIAFPTTDAEDAAAFAFRNDAIDIKSNSWGPFDNGLEYEGPGPLALAAIEDGVQNGRNGLGTIFIWSGGNGALRGDASPFDGFASLRQTIAVGGIDNTGIRAFYAESGSNLLCAAPTAGGTLEVAAVDRPGEDGFNYTGAFLDFSDLNYTKYFGGTSACAPQVAGVVALMLQAKPTLGWRDVKEILIRTARKIHEGDLGWKTNGANFHFNDQYGAGLVDASAAVALAQTWTNLPPEISVEAESKSPNPIPDNNPNGLTRTFVINEPRLRVEQVEVQLDILHAQRGQLEVTLISPTGETTSVSTKLMPTRLRDKTAHYLGALFTTPQHWGEAASGTWTVRVADRKKSIVGTLQRVKLTLYGSSQDGHAAPAGFNVTSGNVVNDAFVQPGETVSVAFSIRNDGAANLAGVTASLLGAGGVLSPSAPVTLGALNTGATGVASFDFTATGALGATIQPMIELRDNGTFIGAVAFPITLGIIETATFSSTASVQLPKFPKTNGNAEPYGANKIDVNIPGIPPFPVPVITKVVLHLDHYGHGHSADVDMLLVSPAGGKMVPMSDVGGEFAGDINLILDDHADVTLPTTTLLWNGRFRPANLGAPLDPFPAPVPAIAGLSLARPYASNFATFNGQNPNGPWRLLIRDDALNSRGGLGSWSLEIQYAR